MAFGGEGMSLAIHMLVDYFGCQDSELWTLPYLRALFGSAIAASHGTILSESSNASTSCFQGVFILQEGHLTFHARPNQNLLALDMYIKDDAFEGRYLADRIKESLRVRQMDVAVFPRGQEIHQELQHDM
jgi:S-adenosylmethionine/arginine decarboxylase-like enzyme